MSAAVLSLLSLIAAGPEERATTSSASRQRVVVLSLRAEAKLSSIAHRLTEELLVHLGKRGDLAVVGESELGALLIHDKDLRDVLACGPTMTCADQMSDALAAELVVTGHVGSFGSGLVVTLSRWDPKRAAADRAESAAADTIDELVPAMVDAAERLFAPRTESRRTFILELEDGGTRIAVLNLEAYDVSRELAENLTQILVLEIRRHESLSVVSRDEIKALLAYEAEKQIVQCRNDVECLIAIGGALGADYLVTGAVGKLEDTWVVHLKLMRVRGAEVVHRVAESFRGPAPQLVQAIRHAIGRLLGRPATGSGSFQILTDLEAGSITIDGGDSLDISVGTLELASGKHLLSVRSPGYHSMDQDFYVEPGQLTKVRADLVEAPGPWYSKWWVWAAIGTAVAIGVTGSAIIATQAPTTGTVMVSVLPPGS
ncbi:MAG: hypothetical protein HY791_06030 [Deltaproteobacteria bacterium]|nr:hypothetical protein [Deltaproteobacteria bacterium]